MIGIITWKVALNEFQTEHRSMRLDDGGDMLARCQLIWETVPRVIRVQAHVLDVENGDDQMWEHHIHNPFVFVDWGD